MKNKAISLRVFGLTLALITAILLLQASEALGRSSAAVANVNVQDRIYLVIRALTQAINDPQQYNLDMIANLFSASERYQALEKIGHFVNSEAGIENSYSLIIDQKLLIKIRGFDETDSNLICRTLLYLRMNEALVLDSINLEFAENYTTMTILDPLASLNKINAFIDSARIKMLPDIGYPQDNQGVMRDDEAPPRSNHLLLPKNYYENIERFTVLESIRLYHGSIIFGGPTDILPIKFHDPHYTFLNHEYMFAVDPPWNRIVITDAENEDNNNWPGEFGIGPYQFKQPAAVAHLMPEVVIVADAMNGRALIYEQLADGSLSYFTVLSNNYDVVSDVASANLTMGSNPQREVAVLDGENCIVDIYEVTGHYTFEQRVRLFAPGSGIGQLQNPSAICYGRGGSYGLNTSYLYVVDAGNNRIVRIQTSPPYSFVSSNFSFPAETQLISIDVDFFGNIYVLDRRNATIYEFSSDLETLFAVYGEIGMGDGQLYYPFRFKMAEAWEDVGTAPMPALIGDAFATEYFGPITGIRGYALGNDVLSHKSSYTARTIPAGYDYITLEWQQSGATETWKKVIHNGVVLQQDYESLNVPGYHLDYYLSIDSFSAGYYTYEVRTRSKFVPYVENTFRDSVYVIRSSCGYDSSSWSRTYRENIIEDMEASPIVDTSWFICQQWADPPQNTICMLYQEVSIPPPSPDSIHIDTINGAAALLLNDSAKIKLKNIDPCGNVNWTKSYSYKPYQYGYSIAAVASGGYIIAGTCGPAPFYGYDLYFIRTNYDGDTIWTRSYGTAASEVAYDVENTADGGFIATGRRNDSLLLFRAGPLGDSLWMKVLMPGGEGYAVKQTSDQGYVVASYDRVIKTNSSGDTLWTRLAYGALHDLIISSDGSYICTGQKQLHILIEKFNSSGSMLWAKSIMPTTYDLGTAIRETSDHGFILSGIATGSGGSAREFFMQRTNRCGDTIWTKVFANPDTSAEANSIAQVVEGGFLIGGWYNAYSTNLNGVKVTRIGPQPTTLAFTCGDADGSGSVNLADVTYLINFLYKGQAAPDPKQCADVNNNCLINTQDVTYLINFLYKGGPPPICP
ncbi:MAG: dockerin type I domain-containing protein [candidate division Zixibacteria bacterium]|nr:dockerin type I domain-containing protein [candidate division Zixibacteria bacterium]